MQLTNVFATLATVLIAGSNSFARAGCYNTGVNFANRDRAAYNAGRACRGYDGNRGALQGVFGPSGKKTAWPVSMRVVSISISRSPT
ncbi:hypothetical protein GLAREA_03318 [Glarea lozoyensis ATCC 20868]|uniref:Uncharacterized protein n=1 Tax=Glarea lozoyensis (strain ATCC 20868 / MF5171) TaxID=1116229 RepID=S3DEG5_GLAL2|nr:uncharacterized protein GLAREA_03318 [Glarea lozoyensis ATCC 20868]EPE30351.1 hypothetical protein GLAREA_03318 [Glarea lozoyensis ATCC 20868]